MNSQTISICRQYHGADAASETKVIKTLLKLGIPANTKGFHYIKTAVLFGIENPIGLTSMSKILYPAIAEYYNSASIASIERAMRYAIGQSCVRGNTEFISEIFGINDDITHYNPTTREFLAIVAEYMRQLPAETPKSLIPS